MKFRRFLTTTAIALLTFFAYSHAKAIDLNVNLGGGLRKKVGKVTIINDNVNIYVTYTITRFNENNPRDNWCLIHTSLQVETSAPNRYEYQTDHNCTLTYTYTVPAQSLQGGMYVIGAYADITPFHSSFADIPIDGHDQ